MAQTIEAEDGSLQGTQVGTQLAGYSGRGYVTGFDNDGDQVALEVESAGGVFELFLRYAAPSGDKMNFVHINGDNVGSVSFPSSASFREIAVGKVFLYKGKNTIAIVKDWGWFELDQLRLTPSQASPIMNLSPALSSAAPSPRADSVYNLLSRLYGKVILSGQYGGEEEFKYIQAVSGRTPVIRGFDMMDYSPSRVERGAKSNETVEAIAWSREKGMVTFCWHWNAPKDLIDEPGKEWWRGFYTEATTFDVSRAMNDAASEEYALIIRDIDAIAAQLKILAEANVPVLWRPLHEAEGKWFWWGAKGPEPCKWLWKVLFERLINHHGLNNLIWVWTSTGSPGAVEWYPGDEYVDIIGADIYLPAGNHGSSFLVFDNIAEIYGGKKMIALSENGPIPHPEKLFKEGAAWSWFATWSGDFIIDGSKNTPTHVYDVFNHDYVVTLDEIDELDNIIARLEERKEGTEGGEPVTNTEENMTKPGLVFQSPLTDNRLLIRTASRARVRIYNLQGQMQFPEIHTSGDHYVEYDFSDKPQGMYLLKVISRKSVEVHRIVKD